MITIAISITYVIIFILLAIALYSCIDFNKFHAVEDIYKQRRELAKKRERVIGHELSKREKAKIQVQHLLKNVGMKPSTFQIILVACGVSGLIVGHFLFCDLLLTMITGVMTLPIPYIILTVKTHAYKQMTAQTLESAMTIITNAYISNNDIIKSITDSLDKIEINEPFKDFVREVTLIDANVERALRNLDAKVNNPYFSDWVDILILSQSDKKYMFILSAIIEDMNDSKRIQIEANTNLYEVWQEFFKTTIIVLSVPLIIKFLNVTWYNTLTNTLPGKILVIALLIAIVRSCFVAAKINKPINV